MHHIRQDRPGSLCGTSIEYNDDVLLYSTAAALVFNLRARRVTASRRAPASTQDVLLPPLDRGSLARLGATEPRATPPPSVRHLQNPANDGNIYGVLRTRPASDLGAQTRLFRALGDPARLAILEALREGELTAGELASAVQLTPSTASRHLACLKSCGLVESRQEWRHVYYRIAGTSTSCLLEAADRVLEDVAGSMAACSLPEMPSDATARR